jgi:DNA (cytosine-5)-methyltransferase 1
LYAIDLFAGAGGLSVGARLAGLHVAFAVEIDPHPAATYSHNHPETTVLQCDVTRVDADALKDRPSRRVDFLFGGPPCQGFSTSNQRTRNSANPINWLFREHVRLVAELQPAWVIFENVKGLIETEHGLFLRAVTESLKKLGYTVTVLVLNAADFGVPQRRKRLFIVGSRAGHVVTPPRRASKTVSVRDALADLPSLGNGASEDFLPYSAGPKSRYARTMRSGLHECGNHVVTGNAPEVIRRFPYVPQGGNWKCIPANLMVSYSRGRGAHTGLYHRLKENEPAIVVGNFRKNMLLHPWEDRGLSVREAARLQSFPDNYRFLGSIGFQQQQVGNAVPPLLAKALFRHIILQYA